MIHHLQKNRKSNADYKFWKVANIMCVKETLKNNIILAMKYHIDSRTLDILINVLNKEFQNVEMVESNLVPSTTDDVNRYVIELFQVNKAPKLSPKTVAYYMDSIQRLILYVKKPITQVKGVDIDMFLNSIRDFNDTVSINNHRRNISAFFTWMRKTHLVIENPCESVEPYKEVKKSIDHLEPEEFDQLKTGCKYKRDRALIEFLRSTAMRVSEIEDIRICDINWDTGWQNIYGKKTRTYRSVGLDSIAMKYLKEYINERNVLYESKEMLFCPIHKTKNNKFSSSGIRSSLNAIKKRAGMQRKIYPHVFRKTTATNIVKRGGSIHDAGEYLGHKDRTTTGKYYAYISESHTKEIFNKYVSSV